MHSRVADKWRYNRLSTLGALNKMKIAVMGTGAMGSVYAGLFASAGNEVWAIDVWQDHIDAINRTGLRVEGASGDRVVSRNLHAANDPEAAGGLRAGTVASTLCTRMFVSV